MEKTYERLWLHTILDNKLSTIQKKWRNQVQLFVASSQSMKNLFKIQKEHKLAQLVKVLYNWGKAIYS